MTDFPRVEVFSYWLEHSKRVLAFCKPFYVYLEIILIDIQQSIDSVSLNSYQYLFVVHLWNKEKYVYF